MKAFLRMEGRFCRLNGYRKKGKRKGPIMKIIKRNGTEVAFDPEKIANAVRKANNEVSEDNRLTEEQIDKITKKVTALANDLNRAVNVEEVQDFVENQIMSEKAFAVARKYITYRYKHDGCADPHAHRVQQRGSQAGKFQQESHRQLGAARLYGG